MDDNETNRTLVQEHVTAWGMQCDQAASGLAALTAWQHAATTGCPYALVLLDMQMPGMNGIMVAHAITDASLIVPPVLVLLTALGQTITGEQRREAGIASCLTKPVKQSQLFACLTHVLAHQERFALPGIAGHSGPQTVEPASTRAVRLSGGEQKAGAFWLWRIMWSIKRWLHA